MISSVFFGRLINRLNVRVEVFELDILQGGVFIEGLLREWFIVKQVVGCYKLLYLLVQTVTFWIVQD